MNPPETLTTVSTREELAKALGAPPDTIDVQVSAPGLLLRIEDLPNAAEIAREARCRSRPVYCECLPFAVPRLSYNLDFEYFCGHYVFFRHLPRSPLELRRIAVHLPQTEIGTERIAAEMELIRQFCSAQAYHLSVAGTFRQLNTDCASASIWITLSRVPDDQDLLACTCLRAGRRFICPISADGPATWHCGSDLRQFDFDPTSFRSLLQALQSAVASKRKPPICDPGPTIQLLHLQMQGGYRLPNAKIVWMRQLHQLVCANAGGPLSPGIPVLESFRSILNPKTEAYGINHCLHLLLAFHPDLFTALVSTFGDSLVRHLNTLPLGPDFLGYPTRQLKQSMEQFLTKDTGNAAGLVPQDSAQHFLRRPNRTIAITPYPSDHFTLQRRFISGETATGRLSHTDEPNSDGGFSTIKSLCVSGDTFDSSTPELGS